MWNVTGNENRIWSKNRIWRNIAIKLRSVGSVFLRAQNQIQLLLTFSTWKETQLVHDDSLPVGCLVSIPFIIWSIVFVHPCGIQKTHRAGLNSPQETHCPVFWSLFASVFGELPKSGTPKKNRRSSRKKLLPKRNDTVPVGILRFGFCSHFSFVQQHAVLACGLPSRHCPSSVVVYAAT